MIFFYGFCCGVAAFGIAVALIELVRWLDKKEESKKVIYPFLKTDGFVRPCRKGCPNCLHCTDVFWDYSNGIYHCDCELNMSGPCCDLYENDGTEPITIEEFRRIKEAEDEDR